ncbi:tRNA lysidine(34) synthetase TilS [Alienimonas sp. DA493]|uniref:tRNA lysidine(34) synthetase TilS n=1 Tax=Alienimonas sp. DA493 TaxID=3373605 RepID=UPI003754E80F
MTQRHPFVAGVGAAVEDLGVSGRVLVACSGGGDSLALLRACVELRDDGTDLTPIAAHFDHRQRPDSPADAAHVAEHARRWDCEVLSGQHAGGPGASEAVLRTARYGWIAEAANRRSAGFVLTGHTADDQAETVLLRIVRGTGVAGLTGIPALGPLPGSPGGQTAGPLVARPMLGLSGDAARDFLTECGVAWRDDPTNATAAYARNRLRLDVLPRLEELNPRVREAVGRLAAAARDEAAATAGLADAVLSDAVLAQEAQRMTLRAEPLLRLPEPARRAALRRAWRRASWPERRMGRTDWERLAALTPGDAAICLPHGVRARYAGSALHLDR